jgi:ribosomal protein S18 acetylase RimI-like enzyme
VRAVLPYRPRPDGGFDAPAVPAVDAAGRFTVLVSSLLRRVATSEIPVAGGVAVLTAPVPDSHQHNQLLVDGDVDVPTLVAEADRALDGCAHRTALLSGAHLAATAAGLAERGWNVDELVGMAAPAGGSPGSGRVLQVDADALRPLWDAGWRRDVPGIDDAAVAQLTDRYRLEEAVVDLRYLAVRDAGEIVAACLLKIDGATAMLDAMGTAPDHRGRGHGDALLSEASAIAGAAGCDLVVLEALAADWPRSWYARHGFAVVARSWSAGKRP